MFVTKSKLRDELTLIKAEMGHFYSQLREMRTCLEKDINDLASQINDLQFSLKAQQEILFQNQKELTKALTKQITARQYMSAMALEGLLAGTATLGLKGEEHLAHMAVKYSDKALKLIEEMDRNGS